MIENIRHIGLVSSNLTEMIIFYERLGFKIIKDEVANKDFISKILKIKTKLEIIKMSLNKNKNNIILELLCYTKKNRIRNKKINDCGFTHMALNVKNLDKFYTENCNKIEFLSEPIVNPEKTAKVCFCKDIEGNYLELVQEVNNGK